MSYFLVSTIVKLTQTIFFGWKDSCQLLQWAELRLVLLASANTVRRTVGLLGRNAVPIVVLSTTLHALATVSWRDYLYEPVELFSNPMMILAQISWAVLMYMAVMTVRTSIESKSSDYYLKYWTRLPFFLVLSYLPSYYLLIPIPWLTAFFFLDDINTFYSFFRALGNGCKLFFAYLPLLLTVCLPLGMAYIGIDHFLNFIIPSTVPLGCFNALRFIIFYGVDLVILSVLVNCYLKIKHSQYQLFFTTGAKTASHS